MPGTQGALSERKALSLLSKSLRGRKTSDTNGNYQFYRNNRII